MKLTDINSLPGHWLAERVLPSVFTPVGAAVSKPVSAPDDRDRIPNGSRRNFTPKEIPCRRAPGRILPLTKKSKQVCVPHVLLRNSFVFPLLRARLTSTSWKTVSASVPNKFRVAGSKQRDGGHVHLWSRLPFFALSFYENSFNTSLQCPRPHPTLLALRNW